MSRSSPVTSTAKRIATVPLAEKANRTASEDRLVKQRVIDMNERIHLRRCHLRVVTIVGELKRHLGVI